MDNKALELQRWNNEKQISELQLKIESHIAKLEDKEQYLEKNNQLLSTTTQQKGYYEETIQENKKTIDKLESRTQICVDEINKGNEIIEKLQGEVKKKK